MPSEDLFRQLGVKVIREKSVYACGKGTVYVLRRNPKEMVMQPAQDVGFVNMVKEGYERTGAKDWKLKNYFYLERGPYTIVSIMTENEDTSSFVLKRPVIDLFNPNLPILEKKIVHPGEQAFLYDLQWIKDKNKPIVLCAAARIDKEQRLDKSYSFRAKSPSGTRNSMRVLLPEKPDHIVINSSIGIKIDNINSIWDEKSHTLLLQFQNEANGIEVSLGWK